MVIDVETVRSKAMAATGLSDFGARHFEEPLARWVEDLGHPRLSDGGRSLFERLVVRDLSRRLQVLDGLKRHPEIEEVVIPPILFISGHERSGTTFLHHLLNLHPESRALLRWELMHPTPPPEAATYRTDPRIQETQASLDRLRGTRLEQMHWVDADDPEECHWGLLNCTSMLGGAAFVAMPGWGQCWTHNQPKEAFDEYRRLIQLLLWKNPPPHGGHLVLKCPQFASHLPAFSQAFPEARFVLTHRDPFRVCTSLCTLVSHINTPFLQQADLAQEGGPVVRRVVDGAQYKFARLIDFDRDSGRDTGAGKLVNIAYPDLVQNPATVVRRVYDAFAFEPPHDLDPRVERFCADQKAGRRAKPPTELPTFGLSHSEFLSRPEIASYCAHFEIEPELKRETGA